MAKFRITDTQTGKTVTVTGPSAPSEADAEEIFRAAGLRQTEAPQGNAVSNFLPSLGRNVAGLVDAGVNVVNPNIEENTLANLLRLPIGLGEKLAAGAVGDNAYSSGNTQRVDAVADFYKGRYGSRSAAGRTFNDDPAGLLLDLSTLISGGGTLAAKAGQLSKTGAVVKAGKTAQTAGAAIDPINALLKTTGAVGNTVTAPIRKAAGKAAEFVEAEAKNLPLQGVRITSPQQLTFQKKHGQTVQDFVKTEKLSDNPVERAVQKADELQDAYDARVKHSGIQTSGDAVIKSLDTRIAELRSGDNELNPPAMALAEKLQAYRDLYAEKLAGQPIGVDRLVTLRQQARKNMRSTKDFQVDPDTANVNVQVYRALNDAIYDAVGGSKAGSVAVREMGKRLNRYYDFIELTEKTNLPATKNRLGEFIKGAGTSAVIMNPNLLPAILAGYGAKRLAGNPTVLGAASGALERGARVSRSVGGGAVAKLSAMQRALKKTNDAARNTGLRLLPRPQ